MRIATAVSMRKLGFAAVPKGLNRMKKIYRQILIGIICLIRLLG
jgi:hypothetical protein